MPIAAIGLGLGAIGGIFGSINSSNASNAATSAASQASAAQNQIDQQQLAIYQQLLQQYNTNVQPLQGQLGAEYQSAEDTATPGLSAYANDALLNPDAATGINVSGLTQNALNYDSDVNDTYASSVYGDEIGDMLQGASGESVLGSTGQQNINSLLSGGLTGNTANPGVGASAVNYYLNQAQNGGINPLLMNNALGQQSTANAQDINNIRNAMGGTSNIGALLQNQNLNNNQSTANLIAQLTGQSQQLETAAEGSALGAAQSVDQQSSANTLQATNLESSIDQEELQYQLAALQSAGSLDTQRSQMINGAQALGSAAQQTQLGNVTSADAQQNALLAQIQNYLAQGQAGATGVATGLQGIGTQYGNSASAAATNAAADASGANPFAGLGTLLQGYGAAKTAATPAPTSLTGVGQAGYNGGSDGTNVSNFGSAAPP